ncbi:hypothetical protein JKP88DRAFT_319962 [Tribonema minus]|uniref:Uncharacterized protein n=1 Tax=Tribonema minus TaxID=303371 RepID=A0A835YWS9_9STRA|nr:hypothetical protein JKP88DRAFT_319962 [Tribonema minus]
MASDFVKRAPADVLLLDHYDWNLTPDDERLSAIRPLTAKEWMVLVKGHGVPEDLLSGTRIIPPLNYADLVTDADAFKPCKEYTFFCSITEDAFFSDIFIPRAFFLMRALHVAMEHATEGVNRDELLRQVFQVVSDNTTAGFNNNVASVFGAIKRNGAERYRPDAMDIAAIRAYLTSADLAWLDTSGQALTYSVNKFIDTFREAFLTTWRRMRADVTVSRALDRGGLKSKKAAGRIPDAEDDSLRDMMRALRKQIWSRMWQSIIAPWLRAHDVPQELQSFLNTNASAAEEGNIVKFADSKGFTSKRDGKVFYTLHMTRAFKTASCKDDGIPQLAKWELSETESTLRVGQLMRDGGINAHVPSPTAPAKGEDECSEQDIECDTSIADTASTAAASDTTDEMDGGGGGPAKPYGKALRTKRNAYIDNITLAVGAYVGDAKQAFDALVSKRKHGAESESFRGSCSLRGAESESCRGGSLLRGAEQERFTCGCCSVERERTEAESCPGRLQLRGAKAESCPGRLQLRGAERESCAQGWLLPGAESESFTVPGVVITPADF